MGRRPRAIDPRLVDPRNRVALPATAMRALDVAPGDYVTFLIDAHGTVRLCKLKLTVEGVRRGNEPAKPG